MERTLLSNLLALQEQLFHIPFYLYDGTERIGGFEPCALSFSILSPWFDALTRDREAPNYLLTRDLLLFGRIQDNESGLYIIIGPAPIGHITEATLHNIILTGRPAIGVEHLKELHLFLSSCATFSLDQFIPLLSSLHGFFNREFISVTDLMVKSSIDDMDIRRQMVLADREHGYEETVRRNNFDFESELMFYVSHGMTEKIKTMRIAYKDMGSLAPDSLRHYKNALIILNTLCQRSAIIGGLNPETSYQLGEIYIQKIEACRDIHTLFEINRDQRLILDYCGRVAEILHPKTNHEKINQAMHYIRENYQKRLTVKEIAKEVGLSSEYLSSKFHEVTGMTLPCYIAQQKITEAKLLLHHTDMPLAEIAEYLSFSSQSYFQTVFKQETGDTPMEYRRLNNYLM